MLQGDLLQILLLASLLIGFTPLIGRYMANVFQGNRTFAHPILGWLETTTYRITTIDPNEKMNWIHYLKKLLLFNLFGFLSLFCLQLMQHLLPLNPEQFPTIPWDLALNTSASFVTNTNWQSYAGETTLSYITQMAGLTVQNFLSAATGCSVLLALIRSIANKESETIGNFWVDLVRSIVYLFLPLSFFFAILLVGEGVIQNFSPYIQATTLENEIQTIPMGPVASQVAIKQLGTNGGGFFNANSAHPFENPTALTNFLELLAIVLIPAGLTATYGIIIGSKKQGWILFWTMFTLWTIGLTIALYSEYSYNPVLGVSGILEGKETRIGITGSILWSTLTTATANGSVNSMLSSLSPLSGAISLWNIMVGELIFGGIGVGLCSMIMFVLLTVFLAGLMVGRTPEYLGKKIEKQEMQWVMASILIPSSLLLIGTSISSVLPKALLSISHAGPHGLSELLYAFASTSGNNGSAFSGLNTNTIYYNLLLALVMIISRASILIPSLAIAGLLSKKKKIPPSLGTFSTDTLLFVILLIAVIFIVGALTFFPALSLGPIIEHLLMLQGKAF